MQFFDVSIADDAIAAVSDVLRSGFLSEGKRVLEFETALAAQLGLSHPVALNSGTSALHLALAVAGVGPGDEVIIPAQTFVATATVVLMQGAKIRFADIQPKTGNIDPASLANAITERTRAIIPVHWAGYPCDLDEIHQVVKDCDAAVIEDAAHAVGAVYRGRPIGSVSRFTAFSFQAIKHLTTGDGGALACLNESDEHEAKTRRWFGIDRANSAVGALGEREYDILQLGYKYHMNDFAAALGLCNLARAAANLARHREIAGIYARELMCVPGLKLLDYREDRTSSYWFFPVLVERRLQFVENLKAHGCVASVVHRRIDSNSLFGGMCGDLPGQTYFDKRHCGLPIHTKLTDDDVAQVVRTIQRGW